MFADHGVPRGHWLETFTLENVTSVKGAIQIKQISNRKSEENKR